MKFKWFKIFSAGCLIANLVSCAESSLDMPTPIELTEIVTVTDTIGPVYMDALRVPPQHDAVLTANVRFAESVKRGDRILLRYTAADTTTNPVNVSIKGYSRILGGKAIVLPYTNIRTLPKPQLKIVSQWHTAPYLNMQLSVKYDGTPRSIGIVASKESLEADTLQLYLYNRGDSVTPNYVDAKIYASFNLSEVYKPGQKIKVNI